MASGTGGVKDNRVKEINGDGEFRRELAHALDKLVVIDFFALWCGPCRAITPKVEEFSSKYPQVLFLKVDVDTCVNTKRSYDIKSMPTFIFVHKNKTLESLVGSDAEALESGIIKHLAILQSESGGSGETSVSVPGQENLNSLVYMTDSECLNESDDHEFGNALSHGSSYLESDCDEQLIISLAFQQAIKIHSMQFVCPQDGRAPKTVKLFINQINTLDFDTAEQLIPVQELTLTPDDINDDSVVALTYVKFQNIKRLTIFIKDNQGDCDTTVIQYLGIYGGLIDSTDMKEFKRVAGDKGERH